MAKGLRSKVKKANKQRLKSNVFGPVEEARKERLSAKLLELAAEPRGQIEATVDGNGEDRTDSPSAMPEPDMPQEAEDMELDKINESSVAEILKPKPSHRVHKKGRSKAKAAMTFPVYKKGKRVGPHISSRQRKQSLKPH